jgi:hypothetical protein
VLTAAAVGFGDQTVGTSASKPGDYHQHRAGELRGQRHQPAGDYTLGADGCTGQPVAAPGGNCVVSVTFLPSAVGARADATIADTVALGSHSVALTGNGVEAPGSR